MSDGQREGRAPYLPSGYRLDEEADFAVVRREDGSEVAVFSATGPILEKSSGGHGTTFGGGGSRRGARIRLRACANM